MSRCALRRRLVEWHALLRQTPEVAREREFTSAAGVLSGGIQHVGLVVPPEGFARLAQQEISIRIAA